MTLVALTIAGSDPSGGAGLQADLKTFHQFGVYGAAVVTLITVQNTVGVSRVETLHPSLVGEQIDAVLDDIPPHAIKTGALGTAAIIEAVAARTFTCPLVVDPVMISKHGAPLVDASARSAITNLLVPRADLLTPNLDEAEELTGIKVRDVPAMRDAAQRILQLGARSVLVKGGHLEGDSFDVLLHDGRFTEFRSPRIDTRHTHGTGCTLSAAIAAGLATGLSMTDAVEDAISYIREAIRTSPGLGSGSGPVNHWADPL